MRRFVEWMRWEFSREIELTAGLRLIILDRVVKMGVLFLGGVLLIIAVRTGAAKDIADDLQRELNLNPGSHLWLRLVNNIVQRFSALSRIAEYALAIAAILYGLLEAVEAFGLLRRKRWAEYLVLLATAAFIPLEVDELVRHVTPLKLITFAINVVIVVYLVWRKKLFLLRRPGVETSPAAPAVPAAR